MDPLKLTGLEIENVLRVRAVKLSLGADGSLIIGGRNEQGKSSVLKALEMALAGGAGADDPIYGDAAKGKILARFDGLTVEKRFSRGKSPQLIVKSADGKTQKSPQTLLSTLLQRVSLDPLDFMRKDEPTQAKLITTLSGKDMTPYEMATADAYESRKEANREAKRLQGALASAPFDPKLPAEEQSLSHLMEELKRRQDHNAESRTLNEALSAVQKHRADTNSRIAASDKEIKRLQDLLDSEKDRRTTLMTEYDVLTGDMVILKDKVAAFQTEDESEITNAIDNCDATNKRIRDNARHREIEAELQAAVESVGTCQEALEQAQEAERKAREEAQSLLPVDGLSINGDAVLYRGKPLSQAGTSAQLRVSVAVAIALNRDSRVRLLLVDDGEALDADNRALLLALAHEAGFQVLMTLVGGKGEAQVIIEDGMIAE